MQEEVGSPKRKNPLIHHLTTGSLTKTLIIVLAVSLLAGTGTGYFLSTTASGSNVSNKIPLTQKPKTAEQDSRTFRDFAEGKIVKKPDPKAGEYSEGTHLLTRDGAVPVALTSSVLDLSLYENKKVKVFGETQKALKEGWLMDVGKVEEVK